MERVLGKSVKRRRVPGGGEEGGTDISLCGARLERHRGGFGQGEVTSEDRIGKQGRLGSSGL